LFLRIAPLEMFQFDLRAASRLNLKEVELKMTTCYFICHLLHI